jgi:hypothetical protein
VNRPPLGSPYLKIDYFKHSCYLNIHTEVRMRMRPGPIERNTIAPICGLLCFCSNDHAPITGESQSLGEYR